MYHLPPVSGVEPDVSGILEARGVKMRFTYLLEGRVEADVSGNFASGRVVVPLTYSL